MCFEFVSPFRLRTLRKQQHGHHNNKTQQPPPLPIKQPIKNNHTPSQHTPTSNQQDRDIVAWNETRWMQPLLRGAADMAVLQYELNCAESMKAEPRIVDRDNAAIECSSNEQSIICPIAMVYINM